MGRGGDPMVAKIAFLFPGQGSQYVGMGKSAVELSVGARALLEQADRIVEFPLSKVMFEGPEERLKETIVTQPALFVASALALQALSDRGIRPSFVAGHSLGEYSALYAAGVISFETGLKLVQARGRAMQEAADVSPGAMAAIIGLNEEKISEICRKVAAELGSTCSPANFNTESQIVISGTVSAVTRAMDEMKQAGAAKVVQLNVSGAFHSALMAPAVRKMTPVIDGAEFMDAQTPVFTNVDAQQTTLAADFRRKLIEQIDHAVRWHDTLKNLLAAGAEGFIEVGSGKVLGTMAKKLDRSKTVLFTDEFAGVDAALATLVAS